MRCSACGARCDPNRSFCRRCGSAVFVDDADFAQMRRRTLEAAQEAVDTVRSAARDPRVESVRRAIQRRPARQATQRAVPAPAGAAAGAGCLAGLVRWAFFVGLIYFALVSLQVWPAVREMVDAAVRGEQVDVLPAVNRVRALFDLAPIERAPRESGRAPGTPSGDAPEPASRVADPLAPVAPPQAAPPARLTPPRVLRQVQPRYPADAFQQGIQGIVVLRARVESDGRVSDVSVVQSIPALDAAAATAVRQWIFEPARQGGTPVAADSTVSVTFRKSP